MRKILRQGCKRLLRSLGYELNAVGGGEVPPLAGLSRLRVDLVSLSDNTREFVEFCFAHLARSHSDNFQDLFVMRETGLKADGYFVEAGGADGLKGSNTVALERQLNWSGIVAEPAKCWHEALARNRSCVIDHRCLADRSGHSLAFRECAFPANSTLDQFAHADRFAASRQRFTRYPVPTVSLRDLLAEHGAPAEFDYLSLDTEGSELMILTPFDFARYRPRTITVEHCHSPARASLNALLVRHGYVRKYPELSHIDDWFVAA